MPRRPRLVACRATRGVPPCRGDAVDTIVRVQSVREGAPPQEVRFCRAPDGVGIAYAVHGAGPPLLIDACWLSHLQFDWDSPVWRHYLVELGRIATVIRYDERGSWAVGSRGDRPQSRGPRRDLEAVVEDAGLDRFALLAMAQGGPVAIEYAARHPERAHPTRLLRELLGRDRPLRRRRKLELHAAFEALIKVGWARPRRSSGGCSSSMMIPGGTEEQMRWIDDLQRGGRHGDRGGGPARSAR